MWSSIQRLTDACIPNNALVLLDIDDTVLHLEGLGKRWWQSTQALYYELEQCPTAARSRTLADWIARVYSATPRLIDPVATRAFLHTLQSTQSSLVFLTARNADLHDITLAQLAACGLDGFPVLHAEAKGEAALEECRKRGAHTVVFIDDMEKNVADVVHYLTGGPESFVELHAYLFSETVEET
jgi:hypothetical protein